MNGLIAFLIVLLLVLLVVLVLIIMLSKKFAVLRRNLGIIVMSETDIAQDMTAVKVQLDQLKDAEERIEKDMLSSRAPQKDIHDSLIGIRQFLSERDKEYRRFQEGYDYAIFKRFSKQVIRCVHTLEDLDLSKLDEESSNVIADVSLDLIDLLDRNGVEEFSPETGVEYASIRAVAEVSSHKKLTTKDSEVGKVAEVVRTGFRYVYNDDNTRLVLPAQVKIYARSV